MRAFAAAIAVAPDLIRIAYDARDNQMVAPETINVVAPEAPKLLPSSSNAAAPQMLIVDHAAQEPTPN